MSMRSSPQVAAAQGQISLANHIPTWVNMFMLAGPRTITMAPIAYTPVSTLQTPHGVTRYPLQFKPSRLTLSTQAPGSNLEEDSLTLTLSLRPDKQVPESRSDGSQRVISTSLLPCILS
ncbi:hypothetical protein NXS19_005287 [Fusarium pseudograminearum]|nr:hypothetical protein NXS19_005287 [Fusarium pseudograminearum]